MPTVERSSRSRLTSILLLALILAAGLTLRTWNVNFDEGFGSHPDERSTACFYAPRIALPSSWEEFKDPHRSPLNPLWNVQEQRFEHFTYGHFPLYLGVANGELLHTAAPLAARLPFLPVSLVHQMETANQPCGGLAVAGRLVIAFLDTLTIWLVYLLGRRIYGNVAGLAAAALYAFTAQAIQLSHFFAMDPASTTFVVLAVLGSVKMVQERNWRSVLVAGVGCGLAIASKFSAAPIVAAPVTALAIVFWTEWRRSRRHGQEADGRTLFWVALSLPAVVAITFLAFFVTSPYAVLDWDSFAQATLVEQGQMVRGIADMPFTRQYRNTLPYVYFVEQQVRWGLGWPLGLVAVAGTAFAAARLVVGRARPGEWLVWSWLLPYFGITGAFLAKFNRYMSPVLPFVLIFAGGLIGVLVAQRRRSGDDSGSPARTGLAAPLLRGLGYLVLAIGLLGGLVWSAAYVNGVYSRPHTWEIASRWVYANAAPGSAILWELWDDPLPKRIPDEPGMDMGSADLRHIDWSPYEEDTAEKYAILQARLQEADFVIYSSKRIYGSVDELPERYPMTTRYYDLMFQGRLGFELVADVTSPPRLFDVEFPDQEADESWSLYDHPRVTIFRKVQDLSPAEFDALLGGSWEGAQAWYRGEESPLTPFLEVLGLGHSPESRSKGLVGWAIARLSGQGPEASPSQPATEEEPSLMLDESLATLSVVDNYRWNVAASENPWLAVGWWWLVVALLGWLAWPLSFAMFRSLRDRGYLLSRALGWLLAGWLLWFLASLNWAENTVVNAWLTVALIGVVGLMAAVWYWPEMREFVRHNGGLMLAGEGLFAVSYLFFVLIRMVNPDLWQPWYGGEKFMEFAFLNGILRSPTFPPVDPHFAGGIINYYYFGIYLVAFLIKLTGIYAEVAFNLAIPTLFALTTTGAFAVAYSAQRAGTAEPVPGNSEADGQVKVEGRTGVGRRRSGATRRPQGARAFSAGRLESYAESAGSHPRGAVEGSPQREADGAIGVLDLDRSSRQVQASGAVVAPDLRADGQEAALISSRARSATASWRDGLGAALLAPLFVALIGNLDGFAQVVRRLAEVSGSQFQSAIPGVETAVRAAGGLRQVLSTDLSLPSYDFWGPSRVIPYTINEFPYWSFLYADLHPHLIGIPFSLLFLGAVLALIRSHATDWRRDWLQALAMLGIFSLLLGTLASVNLWELPTYYGLGVLAFIVGQWRGRGRMDWPLLLGFAFAYPAGAYVLFLPFFRNYENVGASGVGFVRQPDSLGTWLLIWGFFAFVLISWLIHAAGRPARSGDARPTGVERWLSLAIGRFEWLPGLLHWHRLLVHRPSFGYLVGIWLLPLLLVLALGTWIWGRTVLALCLPCLGLATLLLWRRGRVADPGSLFAAMLAATGFAILAGTQVFYLKDFLQGGDWYRMNTLFKFFIQVWVLWGVAAAIALPRVLGSGEEWAAGKMVSRRKPGRARPWRYAWATVCALLLAATFAYPLWGTPARLDQRFPGWRPQIGTLNGLDFMQQGQFTWRGRDEYNQELPAELATQTRYDRQAILWLLDRVQGNIVIVESAQLDYYRAAGTRVASLTGLSGLSGMHQGEQRPGDVVGRRDGLLREFWSTPDIQRTQELVEQLDIALVYVGQLERYLHPAGVDKLTRMAEVGMLTPLYRNEQVTIYAVPGALSEGPEGRYYPA